MIYYLFFSMFEYVSITKNNKKTVETTFGIPGTSTECQNDFRVNPIVERDFFSVGILLVIKGIGLSVTVPNLSYRDN